MANEKFKKIKLGMVKILKNCYGHFIIKANRCIYTLEIYKIMHFFKKFQRFARLNRICSEGREGQ